MVYAANMSQSRAVFAPVIAALVLVLVGTGFAIHAGRTGLRFLASLNNSDPLLATIPPWLSEPERPLSRRVVLVIVDGLSLRHSFNLPYLDELRRVGIDTEAQTHAPSISRPNYVSIVTGVPPLVSGVRNNEYRARVQLDSLMDRLNAVRRTTAYTSDSSSGFPNMFSDDLEDAVYAPWRGGYVRATRNALRRDYALIVALPGAVDVAGHEDGANSDEYREAAVAVDADLAKSLQSVDLTQDTIVITADHGHLERGGHGGVEDDVMAVPLIMAGAGVRRGAIVRDAQLIDVAPTIAALLGVPAPGHGLGRTLVEALDIDEKTEATFEADDAARVDRNRQIVRADVDLARARVDANRARRISLVVSGLAVAVVFLVLGARWGALLIDLRVLVIGVPAFPIAFYALLQVVGGHFSLSSLPDEGTGTRQVFYFGLASTSVHIIATWIALRGRVVLRNRLAAANAVTLVGLLVGTLPAALGWALFDAGPFVELPGPKLLFLIPAGYIAVASFAIAAAVSLSLEIVVFFARVFDPRLPLRRAQRRLQRERIRLSGALDTPDADE